jgi:hypothetical protein
MLDQSVNRRRLDKRAAGFIPALFGTVTGHNFSSVMNDLRRIKKPSAFKQRGDKPRGSLSIQNPSDGSNAALTVRYTHRLLRMTVGVVRGVLMVCWR